MMDRWRLALGFVILLVVVGLAAMMRFQLLESIVETDAENRRLMRDLKCQVLFNRALIQGRDTSTLGCPQE